MLPANWSGTSIILLLLVPIKIIKASASEVASWQSIIYHDPLHTRKRNRFDLYQNSPIYIDAILVPRGVSDQYELVDQVTEGFESFLFWWVTIKKNVDRINFVHFNIVRQNNMTRDAIAGRHEQLATTSLMTYQNRMSLDFLLAEEGGVCTTFSQDCCVFIPQNMTPDL